MANIKIIELTNVETYNTTSGEWETLKQKGATVEDIDTVVLYTDLTGFAPASKALTINWAKFSNKTESSLTIFGSDEGLIDTGTNSIRIRYKIKTTTDAGEDPDVEVISDYCYQLINFDVPDTGTITGLQATCTSSINASIYVKVPAFTNDMVDNASNVQALLSNANSWRIQWTNPSGTISEFTPAVSLGTPVASATAEFGGFYVPVNMTYRLPVSESGAHTLKVYFYPNDGGTRTLFAQSMSCTATVTVNMANQSAPTIYSIDGSVSMTLQFSS